MSSKKKNVLLILTDQLRKDSLGCYGNKVIDTATLDNLAYNGIMFNRTYVANPICMPNRLSIFTGSYPRNHGLWTNGLLLEHERRTLPLELQEHGYQTASFGKIHFTPFQAPADYGNMESKYFWQENEELEWIGPYWGFQHVELTVGHTEPVAHYGRWLKNRGGTEGMVRIDDNAESQVRYMPAELHDSSFVAERTINYIKNVRKKESPFFAVASFPDPHHPFNPPVEYAEKYPVDNIIEPIDYKKDLNDRPSHYQQHLDGSWHRKGTVKAEHPGGLDGEEKRRRIAYTYAMVDLIDKNIGRIIRTLEEEELLDDTIIIFTSDHGELLGDHGLWKKGPFFYEGLINVPLVIYSKEFDHFISEELISSVDIAPTILDLLGIPVPDYADGISFKPHLTGHEKNLRDYCLIEYRNGYNPGDCSSKVLVTEDYKYVRNERGECELTDLKHDPEERNNLVADASNMEILNKMNQKMLDAILSTEYDWPIQICHA